MIYTNFEYLNNINHEDNSHKRIMSSAIYLIAKNGYRRTSTKAIAQTAQVSEALIFKKFSSKQNLLHMVIKEILDVHLPLLLNAYVDELLQMKENQSTFEDAKSLFLSKATMVNNQLGYLKILLFEVNELEPEAMLGIKNLVNRIFDKASILVDFLKSIHVVSQHYDNRLIFRSFIGMINFMIIDLNFISDETLYEEKFNEEFEQLIRLFLKGASHE